MIVFRADILEKGKNERGNAFAGPFCSGLNGSGAVFPTTFSNIHNLEDLKVPKEIKKENTEKLIDLNLDEEIEILSDSDEPNSDDEIDLNDHQIKEKKKLSGGKKRKEKLSRFGAKTYLFVGVCIAAFLYFTGWAKKHLSVS